MARAVGDVARDPVGGAAREPGATSAFDLLPVGVLLIAADESILAYNKRFLAMVEGYVANYKIPVAADDLRREALEWATTRGSRSGRVAWQFIQDLAGRMGKRIG